MYPNRRIRLRALPALILLLAAILVLPLHLMAANGRPAAKFRQPAPKLLPDLFVWTDTCNVYILRDGDAAILIDCGDASVLNRLPEIGIRRVEWVLFTHHHREQCQGAPNFQAGGTQFAGPATEQPFFERPSDFRKMEVDLSDPFTIHGTSFVRPPMQPIPLARAFATNDTFRWRDYELTCIDTRGNSPGSMTYLLQAEKGIVAFSGDLMLDGAKMHTWFDTEWDYGFAAGIQALRQSVARLQSHKPAMLLPSHGKPVNSANSQLEKYGKKLAELERLYVRGYEAEGGSTAYQDKVSIPTAVSNIWQVSPHLFKFKRHNFWPNFTMILSDSGRALLSDCGLLDEKLLDTALEGMRTHFGLKAIDAVIVSHMHGDHFLEAEHLRAKWGTEVWALENMVDKMEHPERFDYCAPVQAYGKKHPDGSRIKGVRVDRAFKPGETFQWEGYSFKVDWMPGQTEFALCLSGVIDGRKVAFTGDNIFGDPDNPAHTGHEAMVAHNSAILEEGYIYGSEFLKRLKPDLLMGGHSFVMDRPAKFIERYRRWSYDMRDAFQSLSPDKDYRYWFDPFWVRAEPYRLAIGPGTAGEAAVHIRNFRKSRQKHRIEIHAPAGFSVEPSILEGEIPASSRKSFPIRIRTDQEPPPGVHIVAFDITLDEKRYGELFDMIVQSVPHPASARKERP